MNKQHGHSKEKTTGSKRNTKTKMEPFPVWSRNVGVDAITVFLHVDVSHVTRAQSV